MTFFQILGGKLQEMVASLNTCKSEKEALQKKVVTLSKGVAIADGYLVTQTPDYSKPISFFDVYTINRDTLSKFDGTFMRELFKSDPTQHLISADRVRELLNNEAKHIKAGAYVDILHDCDDFAMELKGFFEQPNLSGYCFGVGLSMTHAFNWFIDDNKELWIVEPQSGRIFKPYGGMSSHYIMNRYFV